MSAVQDASRGALGNTASETGTALLVLSDFNEFKWKQPHVAGGYRIGQCWSIIIAECL